MRALFILALLFSVSFPVSSWGACVAKDPRNLGEVDLCKKRSRTSCLGLYVCDWHDGAGTPTGVCVAKDPSYIGNVALCNGRQGTTCSGLYECEWHPY